MLQQILTDMYIDPELLSELDEEQKQILFCKMREEQIRRYEEHENKIEAEEKKKPPKPKKQGKKHVDFLEGKDGKEWVWVMGDHEKDKTIEQILEEENHDKAMKLAEKEAEELKQKEEIEIQSKIKEEEERLEREKKQKEEELRKKEEEAALYQSVKEARLAAEALEREKKAREEEEKTSIRRIKQKRETWRRKSIENIEKMTRRRSQEIYLTFKEARKKIEEQAAASQAEVDTHWKKQEEKAKAREAEIKAIAKSAREDHKRNSLRKFKAASKVLGMLHVENSKENSNNINRPPVPERPPRPIKKRITRSTRPPDIEAIVKWYREEEMPKGSGLDPKTEQAACWFHGIISREKSEGLLENTRPGSFLVRVSEKIWGYAVSYKTENRIKHFLIDATPDGTYQFFGTNQIPHDSLSELVNYHRTNVISSLGNEKLLYPVGQRSGMPDYEGLFLSSDMESSHL